MVFIQLIFYSLSVLLVFLQNQVYGSATNQFLCQIEINYWPQYIFVLSTHSQQQWCFCCRRLPNKTQNWKKQRLLFFIFDGRTFKCSSAKSREFFSSSVLLYFCTLRLESNKAEIFWCQNLLITYQKTFFWQFSIAFGFFVFRNSKHLSDEGLECLLNFI